MLISFILMIIIFTSLTVPGQPSPRFHVEAWLPFGNCEMDYCCLLGRDMSRNRLNDENHENLKYLLKLQRNPQNY